MNVDLLKSLSVLILFLPLTCFAQGTEPSSVLVDSLQNELRHAKSIAHDRQATADELRGLLIAKEMSLRSLEQKDSVYQGLLAVQAYRFHSKNKGRVEDPEIYNALLQAARRWRIPVTDVKPTYSNRDTVMAWEAKVANALCERLPRNMKNAEWEKFANEVAYESTCPVPDH
jgi:hypothetical protein